MAVSTGSRSIELAPTNPTASVRASTYAASSGVAIGPPWHSRIASGFTFHAASPIACTAAGASSSCIASCRSNPIEPPTVSPMWAMIASAPASAIARDSSGLNT